MNKYMSVQKKIQILEHFSGLQWVPLDGYVLCNEQKVNL